MLLKGKCWISEATLKNTDEFKIDVYELCGVIQRFSYGKSYAEFLVSSKTEAGSNFPA